MCEFCHSNSALVFVEETGRKISKCLDCLQHFDANGKGLADADRSVVEARLTEIERKKAIAIATAERFLPGLA